MLALKASARVLRHELVEHGTTLRVVERASGVRQRLPTNAPVARHLGHRPTITNYCQDRFVPLLRHAHLPHARERDKSAELGVTHQPKVCNPSAEGLLDLSAELAHDSGSGTGIRILNLAVNRSLHPVQK